jgi:hypothetical protein
MIDRRYAPAADPSIRPALTSMDETFGNCRSVRAYVGGMCRNIRILHNFEPSATEDEIQQAALQYVRKISGSTRPSAANAAAFDAAVAAVSDATRTLLDALVTKAPPRNRETEAAKARARAAERYGTGPQR